MFTSDDDLLEYDDHGVVLYHQHERPSPGGVLAALRTTDEMYADHREIREYVPGGWGSES